MRVGWDSRFTVEQLHELRTLVTEFDLTPGAQTRAVPPLETSVRDTPSVCDTPSARDAAPPVGSFLHRLSLEF